MQSSSLLSEFFSKGAVMPILYVGHGLHTVTLLTILYLIVYQHLVDAIGLSVSSCS